MNRTIGRAILPALVVATLATGLGSTPALATTTCTYDSATHVVTVTLAGDGYTLIGRRASTIVIEVGGSLCFKPGSFLMASVSNTRKIVVTGDAQDQLLSVTLTNGRLAPGYGDEAGTSDEIELQVDLGGGHDLLSIAGTPRADRFRAGTSGAVTAINLNAGEQVGVDADLRATGVESLALFGGYGDDELSARGGKGSGTELGTGLALTGDAGDDLLVGGAGPDAMTTLSILDEPLYDDHDVARGRGGADTLDVADSDGLDEALGGAGVDQCSTDPGDTVSC